jgi:glycosidase
MSQLRGDEEAAKIAASMLLTSPGVPFIYYGEEIGLVGAKPDEDIRRPMQWSADGPGAGFTDGTPWRPPHEDYLQRNVAAQEANPDSLLNHYRTLIHLRNKHDALRLGDWTLVDANPGRLYAFLRHTDDQHLLVLINPSRKIVSDYSLELATGPLTKLGEISLLLGEGSLIAPVLNGRGGFENYAPLESLAPQSTYIIQLSP